MACSACGRSYSIVLVNYKSLDLTRNCLELLRSGLQGACLHIFVVDNDSSDESTEYLRTLESIKLVERKNDLPEPGYLAHGRALDMALEQVETDYLFLLHTDTFVYDHAVFEFMMSQSKGSQEVAAVGCLEQQNRGVVRSGWRMTSRFFKHYTRRSLLALGFTARAPKPFKEVHLKSFFALWNVRLMKMHGLHFQMDARNPGYELQDRMAELNYKISIVKPRKLFAYLDHIQSGTVSAIGGYSSEHRRVKVYNQLKRTVLTQI